MFARLVAFNLGPGQRQTADAMAAEIGPLIRSQEGCSDVTIFGNNSDGRYWIYVMWDTQAHADAAARVVKPRLDGHLIGKVKEQIDSGLYEVISHS
jgi:heme-degrading monooxygenase HmoA